MKIFLIGATGMVGSRILAEAVGRGHEVIAGVRHPDAVPKLAGVTAVAVEATDPATLAPHATVADVIVVAVSPRSTGEPVSEMEAIGRSVIAAAKTAGKRLLIVGGAGSLQHPDGTAVLDGLPDLYRAEATGMRNVRDILLADATADWTFFAPAGFIQPGDRTGKFRLGGRVIVSDAAGNSTISAEDYAVALLDELEQPAHRRQIFTIGY